MTFYQFPQDLFWGSAASGPQSEGRVAGDGKGKIFGTIGIIKIQHLFLIK